MLSGGRCSGFLASIRRAEKLESFLSAVLGIVHPVPSNDLYACVVRKKF